MLFKNANIFVDGRFQHGAFRVENGRFTEVLNTVPAEEVNFGKMLHGGDYNPEQWLHSPEILEKDIEYFKKAKINEVSLGIFSWAVLEPVEGEFHFEWMEKIIDRLYENGISTILATPTGARPRWMAQKYPEVLRVDASRHRNLYGERHNHCYTSARRALV